jgi:DNA-binding transcriptional ArsR family regulator
MSERDPFAVLADPTRRHIVELLASGGPTTATALAGQLAISRQAVAKHLQLLAGAGIASSRRVGRETRFEARLDGFTDVRNWIAAVEGRWTERLALLAASLDVDDGAVAEDPERAGGGGPPSPG